MGRITPVALCFAAALTLWAGPALAIDRLPAPATADTNVVAVADLDRSARVRTHRSGSHGNWRYRAAYTRWLHNEYVVAGYPVHQYRSPTYFWVDACCHYWRHW